MTIRRTRKGQLRCKKIRAIVITIDTNIPGGLKGGLNGDFRGLGEGVRKGRRKEKKKGLPQPSPFPDNQSLAKLVLPLSSDTSHNLLPPPAPPPLRSPQHFQPKKYQNGKNSTHFLEKEGGRREGRRKGEKWGGEEKR